MMKKFIALFFISFFVFSSYAQEVKISKVIQDDSGENITFVFNILPFYSRSIKDFPDHLSQLYKEEKYLINLEVRAISESSYGGSYKKINLSNQYIQKNFSPGNNQSFTIDLNKVKGLNPFFGRLASFEFKLEILPVFIPIGFEKTTDKLLSYKKNKKYDLTFYGPNDNVRYFATIKDKKTGEIIERKNFTSNYNSKLQLLENNFLKKKKKNQDRYTIEIISNKFGEDSITRDIKVRGRRMGWKTIIFGGALYGAYYLFFKDNSEKPPRLPGPPLPGE